MTRPDLTSATVLADSVNPFGQRLTTLEVVFPRYALAEMNTHRVFSRNSASSRAIPVERQIVKVLETPYVSARFPVNQKGMSAAEYYEPGTYEHILAASKWLLARDRAVASARDLLELGVHKQVANRLLEPFMYHTAIISSTTWDNFRQLRLALRPDGEPVADPAMYRAAQMMATALDASESQEVDWADLHLPLVTSDERSAFGDLDLMLLSASRCARSSYERQHDTEDTDVTLARAHRLASDGHLSPLEHPAEADPHEERWANYRGWRQLRHYAESGQLTGNLIAS